MKFFVYVLKSVEYSKSYVSHTDNLERRLEEHNAGKSFYTGKFKPWKLIYNEAYPTEKEAVEKEKYFKTSSGRKYLRKNVF